MQRLLLLSEVFHLLFNNFTTKGFHKTSHVLHTSMVRIGSTLFFLLCYRTVKVRLMHFLLLFHNLIEIKDSFLKIQIFFLSIFLH